MTLLFRFRGLAACAISLGLLLLAQPSQAATSKQSDAGMGIVSGLCTLVYTPAKLIYATGGTLVAGAVFLWSAGDQETTADVLEYVSGGDYSITRSHLRGTRVLRFAGKPSS